MTGTQLAVGWATLFVAVLLLALALCKGAAVGDQQLADLDAEQADREAHGAGGDPDPDGVTDPPTLAMAAVDADDRLLDQVAAGCTPADPVGKQLADAVTIDRFLAQLDSWGGEPR